MKNIILYIMCVVILSVVVISVVQAQYLYALLFAVCDFWYSGLLLIRNLKNRNKELVGVEYS